MAGPSHRGISGVGRLDVKKSIALPRRKSHRQQENESQMNLSRRHILWPAAVEEQEVKLFAEPY